MFFPGLQILSPKLCLFCNLLKFSVLSSHFFTGHHYCYGVSDTLLGMPRNLSSSSLVCVLPHHNLLSVVLSLLLVLLFPQFLELFVIINCSACVFFLFSRSLMFFFLNLYLLVPHVGGFLKIFNSCQCPGQTGYDIMKKDILLVHVDF